MCGHYVPAHKERAAPFPRGVSPGQPDAADLWSIGLKAAGRSGCRTSSGRSGRQPVHPQMADGNCLKAWPHSRQVTACLLMLFRQYTDDESETGTAMAEPVLFLRFERGKVCIGLLKRLLHVFRGNVACCISANVNSFANSTIDDVMLFYLRR